VESGTYARVRAGPTITAMRTYVPGAGAMGRIGTFWQ